MTTGAPGDRAAQLREAFDASFALPPRSASQDVVDLLALRVHHDAYAVLLDDISELVTPRRIVAVPSRTSHLLGLAGIRGGIVPVFGLASILGYPKNPDEPRWMILCGADEPIALAFSDFDGHLRPPTSSLHDGGDPRTTHQLVSQVAHTESGARPIVSIPLVLATIRNRVGPPRPTKEQ